MDSTFVFKYKSESTLDYTGVTGKLSGVDLTKNPYLVLQNIEDVNKKYYLKLSSDSKFEFTRFEPNQYKLWLFYDMDGDGKYSLGKHYPFTTAEQFYYYKDTITLRARWVVTDVNFIVK